MWGLTPSCSLLPLSCFVLSLLHDLLNTVLDLLSTLFGMPPSRDTACHARHHGNTILYQVMVGVTRKHDLNASSEASASVAQWSLPQSASSDLDAQPQSLLSVCPSEA